VSYSFELITPDNKVICDVNGRRKMYLHGVHDLDTHEMLSFDEMKRICSYYNWDLIETYEGFDSLDSLTESFKTFKHTESEGYVLRLDGYLNSNGHFSVKPTDNYTSHTILLKVKHPDHIICSQLVGKGAGGNLEEQNLIRAYFRATHNPNDLSEFKTLKDPMTLKLLAYFKDIQSDVDKFREDTVDMNKKERYVALSKYWESKYPNLKSISYHWYFHVMNDPTRDSCIHSNITSRDISKCILHFGKIAH
jgi:hypothetical protein